MADTRLRLGQLLVDARMLTQQALDEVLALQRADGRRLGTLLVEKNLINETQLTQILSHQLSVPWVSLLHVEFSRQLLNLVPREIAEKYCLVPIYVRHVRGQGDTLYVAMNDPTNEEGLVECTSFSGLPVRAMIAPPSDIVSAIRVYYEGVPATPPPASSPAAPIPVAKESPEHGSAPARARRSERPRASRPPPAPSTATPAEGANPLPAAEAAQPAPPSGPSKPPPMRASTPPARRVSRPPPAPVSSPPPAPVSNPPPAPVSVAPPAELSWPPPPAEEGEPPRVTEEPPTLSGAAARSESTPPAWDGPTIETVELSPRLAMRAPPAEPGAEDDVPGLASPGGKVPRMVSVTLLDGTTINLPARDKKKKFDSEPPSYRTDEAGGAPRSDGGSNEAGALTARDMIAALRAVAHGADATEILGSDTRWEPMFAALLSLLLRKHLIADWEFVEEYKKI